MLALTSQIETPYHRIGAGWKLAAVCAFTLVVFAVPALWFRGGALMLVIGLYLFSGRVFLREGGRMLRPFMIFVLIIGIWHLVTASYQDGARILLMLLASVGLANLVTMTTRLDDMIGVVRWCAAPLRRFGVSTRVLELAIALVIRFTPVLIRNGTALSEAWRARSTRKAGWRVLAPFAIQALDDADQVALALRARGGVSEPD